MSYIGQVPLPQATEERIEKTATAGQTLFTGLTYVNGFISVYLNGVKLDNADFTATDGTTVTLGTGAAAGDTVSFVSTTQTSALMSLPLKDSAGNNVISESGGTVTLGNATLDSTVKFPAGTVIQVKTSILTTDITSTSTSGEIVNANFKVTLTGCTAGNLIIAYLMGGQLAITGSTSGHRVQLYCTIESTDVYGQFNKNYANQSSGGSTSYSGAAISNMFFHTITSSNSFDVVPKIRVQDSSKSGTLFADDGTSGSGSNAGPCRLAVMEIQE